MVRTVLVLLIAAIGVMLAPQPPMPQPTAGIRAGGHRGRLFDPVQATAPRGPRTAAVNAFRARQMATSNSGILELRVRPRNAHPHDAAAQLTRSARRSADQLDWRGAPAATRR